MKTKVLIVGGDSRLAKVLKSKLKDDYNVYETTRRIKKTKKSFFLNFENIKNFKTNIFFDFVLIVGGVTDYKICNDNYKYAYKVNCVNIPEIAKYFLKKKSFIVFVSTNTVFKYKKKIPDEDDLPNPGFNYAKLKLITEKKIRNIAKKYRLLNRFSILRLTKNVDKKTSPFDVWIKSFKKDKRINAFDDLYFSPILFEDSASVIMKIIKKKLGGIFHLSGEKDLNYYSFAKALEKKFRKKKIVFRVNSKDIGVKLIYNHFITSLNMKKTSKQLNHKPVKVKSILNYLSV